MLESLPKKINKPSLERLLKENIKLNKKIYESCQKIEKYIFFTKVFATAKFVLIFIPIIIGVLFLIPFVGDFLEIYKNIFANIGEVTGLLKNMKDIQSLQTL